MTSVVVTPDERAVRRHLAGGRFLAGVAAGRWRLISLEWPYATFAISAVPRESAAGIKAPSEYVIRLEVLGYPHSAPTGNLWDPATSALPTSGWPRGDRADQIFRTNWEGGAAMYAAWDRVTLAHHADWPAKYPHSAWHAQRDITFILENVYEVLNADDYLGL